MSANNNKTMILKGKNSSYLLQTQYLGSGAISEVRLGQNVETKENVAIKIITNLTYHEKRSNLYYNAELEVSKYLCDHNKEIECVVKIYDVIEFLGQNCFYVVMEYMPEGNLCDFIQSATSEICNQFTLLISLQIAKGLQSLHKLNVLHRDLKPENIFIKKSGPLLDVYQFKIGDFGMSKILRFSSQQQQNKQSIVGTPNYMAPEVYSQNYGFQSDIWSLGCLIYETSHQKQLFTSKTMRLQEIYYQIKTFNGILPESNNIHTSIETNGLSLNRQNEVKQESLQRSKLADNLAVACLNANQDYRVSADYIVREIENYEKKQITQECTQSNDRTRESLLGGSYLFIEKVEEEVYDIDQTVNKIYKSNLFHSCDQITNTSDALNMLKIEDGIKNVGYYYREEEEVEKEEEREENQKEEEEKDQDQGQLEQEAVQKQEKSRKSSQIGDCASEKPAVQEQLIEERENNNISEQVEEQKSEQENNCNFERTSDQQIDAQIAEQAFMDSHFQGNFEDLGYFGESKENKQNQDASPPFLNQNNDIMFSPFCNRQNYDINETPPLAMNLVSEIQRHDQNLGMTLSNFNNPFCISENMSFQDELNDENCFQNLRQTIVQPRKTIQIEIKDVQNTLNQQHKIFEKQMKNQNYEFEQQIQKSNYQAALIFIKKEENSFKDNYIEYALNKVNKIEEKSNSLSTKGSSQSKKSINSNSSTKPPSEKTQLCPSQLKYSDATQSTFEYFKTEKYLEGKISSQAVWYPRYRSYIRSPNRKKSFLGDSFRKQEIDTYDMAKIVIQILINMFYSGDNDCGKQLIIYLIAMASKGNLLKVVLFLYSLSKSLGDVSNKKSILNLMNIMKELIECISDLEGELIQLMETLKKIEEKERISFENLFLGQKLVNVSSKKTKGKSVKSGAIKTNAFDSVYISLNQTDGLIFLSQEQAAIIFDNQKSTKK